VTTPSPSPTPLDVYVHTGPAEWWQILAALGPLAILLGALLAAFIGWNTLRQRTVADERALAQKREADTNALRQKTEADSRAEWWRRTQWALEASLNDKEEKQDIGLAVLEQLSTSNLAGPEEAQIIAEAWKRPLENGEATLDLLPPIPDNGVNEETEEVER
jgi:hypothetical protein